MRTRSTSLVFGLLIACLNATFAQAPPPASFLAARTFGTGLEPFSIAVADLNGDGKIDLVVANYQDGDVSVLLANGDGTFQTAVNYPAGTNPQSVAIGDFNGDGKVDLAVANRGDNDVSVLLGNGDGTFQASLNYGTGSNPCSVVVGDFNGDGKLDLAVTNNSDNDISVLVGNGDGTFQAALPYATGSGPYAIAAGDFNGDGKLDLAVTNFNSNNVSILLGNGDGTFQTAVNYGNGFNPQSVVTGDFNGDGKLDLAVANACSNSNCPHGSVSVFLGNGDGTFGIAVNYDVGSDPLPLVIGDFNGDGKPDVAVANGGDNTISVLLGNGDGTLQNAVNYGESSEPISLAVADFNADSKPDLAVANFESNNVAVLLGKGDGTFLVAPKYSAGAVLQSVATADFNNDGKPDLVAADSNGNDVAVLLGNGDGTFQAASTYRAGTSPNLVAVSDFNGDGKPDLVAANLNSNNVSVLLGVGDGTFMTAVNYDAGSEPWSVAVGDFNGDGKTDLAVADFGGGVSILLGNGDGTFQAASSYASGSGPRSVAIGDFNGDGKADIAVADGGGGISVLLGNGDGTFLAAVSYAVGAISYSIAAGDFNGDGKLDLAVANSGNISVLLGNGDGTFQTAVNYSAGSDARSVTVGDFNGDGKPDLAVANEAGSGASVLLGNGDGTFQAPISYGAGSEPVSVGTADFNGDGRLDLVLANFGSGDLSISLNTTPFSGASITSPVPNSTLSGSSVTFQWSTGTGATAYWIDVGPAAGGNQYYSSGSLPTTTLSATVNSLPADGSTVYVTLYSFIAGQWTNHAYTYTASGGSSAKAVMTSPVPSSTLSGSNVTFIWTAGTSATAYWVDVGSTADGHQYSSSGNLGNVLTTAVSGVPTDGSTVYVTLYSLVSGVWLNNEYTYTAFNGSTTTGTLTIPPPGSTLTGSSVAFGWSAGSTATAYWVDVGSTAGAHDYFSSGNLGNVLTVTVNSLPTNGSAVYVTLYSMVSGAWLSNPYTYTAFNVSTSTGAVMTSPAPGSTLTGSSVTFGWTAGAGASAYWVDVGSTAGGHQYFSSGNLGNVLTTTVNGLPTDGSAVYVTLYSLISGAWINNAYTYTASSGLPSGGILTTPAPGSTLTSGTVNLSWTAGNGASAYWIDVGASAGAHDYYSSGNLGNVLTTTVSGLPTNGSMIYVTLYSLIGGQWLSAGYTYTAFSSGVGTAGVLTAPTPGSTLAASSVTFTWTAGSGAAAYWIDVGSTAGGHDYYSSGNLGNVLSTTASGLPTNGGSVYVTLYSMVNGQWISNTYTYNTLVTYPGSTFFVAPNGNDSWNGDLPASNSNNSDGPFASLSRAQKAVQNAAKPATVIVRNGTYYPALTPTTANTSPGKLAFTSADSGYSSSAQVIWQNYPGETPVISGGVPANTDPITGAGLQLQWTNSGNLYQASLPLNLANGAPLQPFEYLYYNGQRRLRSRIHDNGTSSYPSIGYFMKNGQCVATPSTPAGQQSPTLASCDLGTFLRVANTVSPGDMLGKNCPSASGIVNSLTVSKCLDRFYYTPTGGGDSIQTWQNLNGTYNPAYGTGNASSPCTANTNSYPAGDIELTLIDAWTVDVMRVGCVDTTDNVIFLLGATKGGGTTAAKDTNYNYLGPTIGHRYVIENTLDAFNDALTPSSSQYGLTGIWFLDRHTTPWVLNYIANQGENPSTDNIVIPQLGGAIPGSPATDYVGGSLISASNLEYVTFQGINFEVDNFYPNAVGFNNDVNGEMSLPQAIDCETCQFVTFNGITVRHTSASGILAAATAATPSCSGSSSPSCVVIENSTFYDIGDSGIRVGHTVSSTDTSATVVQGILAQNNLIQGYSRVFPDGEGIAEANGNSNTYAYNTITDGYHAGISICKDGCGPTTAGASVSGNNISSSYNLISNIIQGITSDGGAIFYNIGSNTSSGTGNSINGNIVDNVTDSFIIDNPSTAGVTVAGSAYGGEGIYLDGQSAGVQVSNNVVYNLSGHAVHIAEGLASSAETQNTLSNNIFAFANLGMFVETLPWPNGCPSSPIKQVDVTNNMFYFDRSSTSSPSFAAIGGCSDSCGQPYNTYQNFQGNSYWRTDGQFAADKRAFQVLTTQGLTAGNACRTSPTTLLLFSSQTSPSWQSGGAGVPVAMNEELNPNGTATYQPPFTGSGLATDPPSAYSFATGQSPPTQFSPSNTNLTITNAHSSLSQLGTVPATFPTYVYGSSLNKF